MAGWMDGWMKGGMNGWMNDWMDGGTLVHTNHVVIGENH